MRSKSRSTIMIYLLVIIFSGILCFFTCECAANTIIDIFYEKQECCTTACQYDEEKKIPRETVPYCTANCCKIKSFDIYTRDQSWRGNLIELKQKPLQLFSFRPNTGKSITSDPLNLNLIVSTKAQRAISLYLSLRNLLL